MFLILVISFQQGTYICQPSLHCFIKSRCWMKIKHLVRTRLCTEWNPMWWLAPVIFPWSSSEEGWSENQVNKRDSERVSTLRCLSKAGSLIQTLWIIWLLIKWKISGKLYFYGYWPGRWHKWNKFVNSIKITQYILKLVGLSLLYAALVVYCL